MQVTVSRTSPVNVELQVALPKDKVHGELEKAFNELGKVAQIRGFRKGKVPRPILRQYFGPRVANEVVKKLIDDTLPNAIRDQKLEPVNTPEVISDEELKGDADWSYTVRMEVRPDIADVDYSVLTLSRKVYQVDDHDVQHVLDAKREEAATLRTPDPARPVQAHDQVSVDLDVVIDGTERPEFGARGRTVEAGGGTLLKELDEGLIGMAVDETREFQVTFPEAHRQSELRGRTAAVKVTVKGLQEKVLPEIDDEFAKDLGKESLDELRGSIRADLEKDYKERAEDELRNDAVEKLVAAHAIAVPPSLTTQVVAQMKPEATREFLMMGSAAPQDLEDRLRPEAERRVRAGLLLTEIARVNGLQVTDADLNGRLEEMAKSTGKAVQKLRVEYRDQKKREMLIGAVLEDKVVDFLLAKATITEQQVPTHAHDHEHGHEHEAGHAGGAEATKE